MLALKALALAVPGANYALLAWGIIQKYWKPIALVAVVLGAFVGGIRHERKKSNVAALKYQVTKLTWERDNLFKSAAAANLKAAALEAEAEKTRKQVNDIVQNPPSDDCVISPATRKRLLGIRP